MGADTHNMSESHAERTVRHARIVAALTAHIPVPYKAPPKPRATYLKLKPGDRLRTAEGTDLVVQSCDSEGMWLAPPGMTLAEHQRWVGPWEGHFVKVRRPKKSNTKVVDNPTLLK